VFLNDTPLEVVSVTGYEGAVVQCQGKTFRLSDKENTEVMPKVMVCCGKPYLRDIPVKKGENSEVELVEPESRLIFEAPQSVRIFRESIYYEKHPGAKRAA
jgi:hypothetical protein